MGDINISKELISFLEYVDNNIISGDYKLSKKIETEFFDRVDIIESIIYKFNCVYYFNTQIISSSNQIKEILTKKVSGSYSKGKSTELVITAQVNSTYLNIHFDSLIFHLASLFDVYAKLINYFYYKCSSKTINKLVSSLNDNYEESLITKLFNICWSDWVEIIYDYRATIYHKRLIKLGDKYEITIDSLGNISGKCFDIPCGLYEKFPNSKTNDVVEFSKKIIMLTEKLILYSIEIIKYEIFKEEIKPLFLGGVLMNNNELFVFENGKVLSLEQLNKNFEILFKEIEELKIELAKLKNQKIN
ncbi:MAG: hypothetical protein PHP82_03110 [Candidatus ainarchaeum sp.]|nr:hypothetical protein [Candidatus ainarchaeum sp.]